MLDWYRKENGEIDREKVIDELERDFERLPDEETHLIGIFDQEAVECALELLKAQEPIVATDGKLLQEFFTDVKASNSILNSVNNHCLTLETVSKIIMLCGPACDVLSPDGFIKWLKDRITDDSRIREEVMQNEKD